MSGQRNSRGVNDSCQLYRTVGGVRYEWAYYPPTPERMKALRAAGLRVRRFKVDGGGQLFVHPEDEPEVERLLSTILQEHPNG